MDFMKKHGLLDWDFVQPMLIVTVMLVLGELL